MNRGGILPITSHVWNLLSPVILQIRKMEASRRKMEAVSSKIKTAHRVMVQKIKNPVKNS